MNLRARIFDCKSTHAIFQSMIADRTEIAFPIIHDTQQNELSLRQENT